MAFIFNNETSSKEINFSIPVDNGSGIRDVGVFRGSIGCNMDNSIMQIGIYDKSAFEKEFESFNSRNEISKYFLKFMKEFVKQGIENGHFYMQDVYNILNSKNNLNLESEKLENTDIDKTEE